MDPNPANIIDASEIDTNLWQGSVPPRGRLLSELGFGLVVLCAHKHQYESEKFKNIKVHHVPLIDDSGYPPESSDLSRALDAARVCKRAVEAGTSVLVTCFAGINRSGLVVALTLHLIHGWSGKACINKVRIKRGGQYGFTPLSNPFFERYLSKIQGKEPEEPLPEGWSRRLSGLIVPS